MLMAALARVPGVTAKQLSSSSSVALSPAAWLCSVVYERAAVTWFLRSLPAGKRGRGITVLGAYAWGSLCSAVPRCALLCTTTPRCALPQHGVAALRLATVPGCVTAGSHTGEGAFNCRRRPTYQQALAEGAVLPAMAAGSTHEVSLAELVPAGEVVQAQKLAAQKKQLAAQAQQRAAQAQRQAQQQGQQRQTTSQVVDLTGESPRSVLACKGVARRSRAQVRLLGRTGAAGRLRPCLCLLESLHGIHAADTAFCTALTAPVAGRHASSGGACWAQQAGRQHRFHGCRHCIPGSRPRRASKHWAALRWRCCKHQGCGEWQAGVGVPNAFAAVGGCPAGRLARLGTCLNCAWSRLRPSAAAGKAARPESR